MEDIWLSRRPDGAFDVEVRSARGTTRHRVIVPDDLLAAIGLQRIDRDELVRASFAFLLEREPATSILRSFSLDVISDYFPEYREEIARRLAGARGDRPQM